MTRIRNDELTMLTERDIPALAGLARYRVLNRRMIQLRYYRDDPDGRITRRRLGVMHRAGFIHKARLLVVNPDDGAPCPVYYLAPRGAQFLSEHFHDDRYLVKPTSIAQPMHLHHYVAVAATHMLVDDAAEESGVNVAAFFHEEEPLNPEADRKQHIRLYSELRTEPKKLVCAPDAAFLLDVAGHRGVFYVEQDRDRDNYSHRRVAAMKTPGYSELYAQGFHRRHFPTTTLNRFTVLLIAPHPDRRDALRRAFRGKDGSQFLRFSATTDLSSTSFFHGPVWFLAEDGEPGPLVKRP